MSINRFFNNFFGNRKIAANSLYDYVEVLSWEHSEFIPAKHIALEITQSNKKYYLSFSPATLMGLAELPLLQQRDGVSSYFVKSKMDEMLIRGFVTSWYEIKNNLNSEQIEKIANRDLSLVSSLEILEIAKLSSNQDQEKFKMRGNPSEVITLRTLDLTKMIERLESYKSNSKMKWASWAGTYFRKSDCHNCASIVLDVLYFGGLNHLLTSYNDFLGTAGALLGASYAFYNHSSWIQSITNLIQGFLLGRGLGGACEGYVGAQSFLNLVAIKKNDSLSSVLGLRILIASFSAFLGVIKPGAPFPALLTFPRDVLNLAQDAKNNEESLFIMRTINLNCEMK